MGRSTQQLLLSILLILLVLVGPVRAPPTGTDASPLQRGAAAVGAAVASSVVGHAAAAASDALSSQVSTACLAGRVRRSVRPCGSHIIACERQDRLAFPPCWLQLLSKHLVGVPITMNDEEMARYVVDMLAAIAEHGGLAKNDGGHGGDSSHDVLERGLLIDLLLQALEPDAAPGLRAFYSVLEWHITMLWRAGLVVDLASKFILMVYIL